MRHPVVIDCHLKGIIKRREGTTDDQDAPGKYTSSFPILHASITEDDAQNLADRIAANTFPLDTSKLTKGLQDSGYSLDKRVFVNPGFVDHKRTKVDQPDERGNVINVENEEVADVVQKRAKINRPENTNSINGDRTDNYIGGDNTTFSNDNGNATLTIDPSLSQAVQERFHFKPVMDMLLQCSLTGKSEPLVGWLKYLGHLNSLPSKRNTVVAGIELQSQEELGTDGTFLGKRYFYAPYKRAYFVPIRNCAPRDV